MEEVGIIRRTIQDVLVPEMQAIKERLAGQDERFVSIEKRFDQVDQRFDLVDKRFEQVDKRFEQVDKRFEQIEKRFEQIDKRFEQIDKRFEQIERRLDALEKTMTEGFAALRAAIDRIEARLSFSELDKRLLRLEILHEHGSSGPKSSAA